MAAETADIRAKSRRVKNHILTRYLKLADRVDEKGEGDLSENEAKRYWELTSEFARNVVPRSQEISGEDGGPLNVVPIYGGLSKHDSDSKDIQPEQKD